MTDYLSLDEITQKVLGYLRGNGGSRGESDGLTYTQIADDEISVEDTETGERIAVVEVGVYGVTTSSFDKLTIREESAGVVHRTIILAEDTDAAERLHVCLQGRAQIFRSR